MLKSSLKNGGICQYKNGLTKWPTTFFCEEEARELKEMKGVNRFTLGTFRNRFLLLSLLGVAHCMYKKKHVSLVSTKLSVAHAQEIM